MGTFTGGDVGEGLDLDGNFVYAVNLAGPGGFVIRDAEFTDDSVVSIDADYSEASWLTPNLGDSSDDDDLEAVLSSIRWSSYPGQLRLTGGVEPGVFKLQLLFMEGCCTDRIFSIDVDNQILDSAIDIAATQGGLQAPRGVVVTYVFAIYDTSFRVTMEGPSWWAGDRNPHLAGFTLEKTRFEAETPSYFQRFTGGDMGEGLDLEGDFEYAVSFGGPGGFAIRDAVFTDDSVVNVVTPYVDPAWNSPTLGLSNNDTNLETVMQSIRGNALGTGEEEGGPISAETVAISAAVDAGTAYKLQLLFMDGGCCSRAFPVQAEGRTVLPAFYTQGAQGWDPSRGVVVVDTFVAEDDTLDIVLGGGVNWAPNQSAILSGLTLERIGVGPPEVEHPALALWLDASDPDTLTALSDEVVMWRDKSRRRNDAISYAAGKKPVYLAAEGSVRFANDFMEVRTLDVRPSVQDAITSFAVYEPTGGFPEIWVGQRNAFGTDRRTHTASDTAPGERHISTVQYVDSRASLRRWIDGWLDLEQEVTYGDGGIGIGLGQLLYAWHGYPGAYEANYDLKELIVFTTELDQASRLEVEEYLEQKWEDLGGTYQFEVPDGPYAGRLMWASNTPPGFGIEDSYNFLGGDTLDAQPASVWRVRRVHGEAHTYTIQSQANGLVLDGDDSDQFDYFFDDRFESTVLARKGRLDDSQKWIIRSRPNGRVTVQEKTNSYYLSGDAYTMGLQHTTPEESYAEWILRPVAQADLQIPYFEEGSDGDAEYTSSVCGGNVIANAVPCDVPDLALWLDASSPDRDAVATDVESLRDLSGLDHQAVSRIGRAPRYNRDGTLAFRDSQMAIPNLDLTASEAITSFAVVRSMDGDATVWMASSPGASQGYSLSVVEARESKLLTLVTEQWLGQPSATFSRWYHTESEPSASGSASVAMGPAVGLGQGNFEYNESQSVASAPSNYDLAELLIYHRALDAAERLVVQKYLQSKWFSDYERINYLAALDVCIAHCDGVLDELCDPDFVHVDYYQQKYRCYDGTELYCSMGRCFEWHERDFRDYAALACSDHQGLANASTADGRFSPVGYSCADGTGATCFPDASQLACFESSGGAEVVLPKLEGPLVADALSPSYSSNLELLSIAPPPAPSQCSSRSVGDCIEEIELPWYAVAACIPAVVADLVSFEKVVPVFTVECLELLIGAAATAQFVACVTSQECEEPEPPPPPPVGPPRPPRECRPPIAIQEQQDVELLVIRDEFTVRNCPPGRSPGIDYVATGVCKFLYMEESWGHGRGGGRGAGNRGVSILVKTEWVCGQKSRLITQEHQTYKFDPNPHIQGATEPRLYQRAAEALADFWMNSGSLPGHGQVGFQYRGQVYALRASDHLLEDAPELLEEHDAFTLAALEVASPVSALEAAAACHDLGPGWDLAYLATLQRLEETDVHGQILTYVADPLQPHLVLDTLSLSQDELLYGIGEYDSTLVRLLSDGSVESLQCASSPCTANAFYCRQYQEEDPFGNLLPDACGRTAAEVLAGVPCP